MKCVQCGQDDDNGNTQTCCSQIKLFGVQIALPTDDGGTAESSSIRKCRSMDNLEACISGNAQEPSGYLSDGFVHQHSKSHQRKRGKAWSEEEHRSFLEGLEKTGKGDWKGIATKFVPSRKSSQVASHAQKYFNRLNFSPAIKKRRRASVFDIPPSHHNFKSQTNNIAHKPFHINPHERPPLSPMQPYFHGFIYLQPCPTIPWPQTASFVPNTSRQGWFQAAASSPSTTDNLNIRNLAL